MREMAETSGRTFEDGTRIISVRHPDGADEVFLEADGKSVSRTYIVPMLMRIGAAVVRMDGIGGVATEDDYRYRGYSRRVMEAAVEQMRAGDAAISTLYGIPDFYPKYGYATTGPEYTMSLPLDEDVPIPPLPDGWSFRPFVADDLTAVQRIYQANTRRSVGPLVRHEAGDELPENAALIEASPAARNVSSRAWKRLMDLESDPGEDACRVLRDETGTAVAYAWIGRCGWWVDFRYRDEPETFHLGEVMASHPAAADAVLAACCHWANESGKGFTKVELVLPPEGLVAAAAALAGGNFGALHARAGQFMGRVLDIDRLLRQLQPELAERIRVSRVGFRGQLLLKTDEGEAALAITPDDVSVVDGPGDPRMTVELPQTALARLTLGAFDAGDLLARLPEPPGPEAVAVVGALFPRRTPHIYAVDRF